jgi:murein DD-endopeptidase MepM/ murein hydrolase activator NlpD
MLEKIAILLSTLLSHLSSAQEPLPQNYFRSPIDTAILLAGNFGELRPNHFHAGIDIKTNNREGMPVHAAAEGFVSRIKISSFGYGKVIYVTHPNGFVTVYGHLRSFNDTIGTYIKRQQYAQKTFEIEVFPKSTEFPVKKGEVIAFSGNTGNSGGPHIHFEIRDEKSEKAINPLLFGLPVTDNKKPQVTRVKIYPGDADGLINGVNKEMEFRVKITKQGYLFRIGGI